MIVLLAMGIMVSKLGKTIFISAVVNLSIQLAVLSPGVLIISERFLPIEFVLFTPKVPANALLRLMTLL
jgi:hypothetical protein